ncbi:hypothetical protein HK102_002061, partial [Quaeritorhiza haematococci]
AASTLTGISCHIFDNGCASQEGLAIAILCGIALALFLPYAAFMSFTYFEPHLDSEKLMARPNGMLEFLELVAKAVIIITYQYTETTSRTPFIILEIILYTILLSYVYFFLPFFHRRINIIKFMVFSELLFSSIIALIVHLINNPNNAVIYISVWATVSLPICVGSFFLISAHQKDAVSGLYHMIMNHPQRPALPLKEEQERIQDGKNLSSQQEIMIDETFYAFAKLCLADARFLTYHQVEISTRFIKTFTQPSDLTIALAIYECGLERFPKSATLQILYGLFQGTYMGKTYMWDASLKKAAEMDPNPLAEFFIYQQKGELRVRAESKATGREMNMVDSMEFTHMIRQARKCQKQAMTEIINFWRIMSSNKVDENRLQRVVSKITYLEETGLRILETLRRAYPKDIRILTMYAKFCDDVAKNFKKSNGLYALIGQLQEVAVNNAPTATLAIAGNSQSALIKASTGISQTSIQSNNKNSSYGSSIGGFSAAGKHGNYSRKEMRAWVAYRKQIQKMKQDSNRWSILAIGIIMVVMAGVSIGQAVWVNSTQSETQGSIKLIKASSFRRDLSVELADFTRILPALIMQNQTERVEKEREHIFEELEEFEYIQFQQFFEEYEGSQTFKFWLDPEANIVVWRGDKEGWTANGLNQFDASSEFWRHQRAVLQMDPEFFRNGSYKFHPSYRFVVDNLPFTYGDAYNLTAASITVQEEDKIRAVLLYSWVAFGAVCGVLVLIGAIIFRTVTIRHKNLGIIRQITQEVASGILAQIQAQRLASQVNTNNEDDDDDDDDDNSNMRSVSSASTKALYAKLTFIYVMTLTVIAGVFAISVGMNFVYLTALMRWGRRVDLTLQLRFLIERIAYSSREIVNLNDFTYMPPTFLETQNMTLDDYMQMNSTRKIDAYHHFTTDNLQRDLNEFNTVQFVLLFGDPSRGIPKGRVPSELSDAMFVRRYLYNNFNRTTDEFVNMMLEDLYSILQTADKQYVDPNSKHVQRIRDVYLFAKDGFTRAAVINEKLLDIQAENLRVVSLLLMSCLIIVVLVIYFFVLRRFIEYLRTAGAESTKLLLLIPPDIAQKNFDLQVMIRGREEAIYFFQENNFELPNDEVKKMAEMQAMAATPGRRNSFLSSDKKLMQKVQATREEKGKGSSKPPPTKRPGFGSMVMVKALSAVKSAESMDNMEKGECAKEEGESGSGRAPHQQTRRTLFKTPRILKTAELIDGTTRTSNFFLKKRHSQSTEQSVEEKRPSLAQSVEQDEGQQEEEDQHDQQSDHPSSRSDASLDPSDEGHKMDVEHDAASHENFSSRAPSSRLSVTFSEESMNSHYTMPPSIAASQHILAVNDVKEESSEAKTENFDDVLRNAEV